MLRHSALALFLVSFSFTAVPAKENVVSVFDGTSLDGWVQRGGEAVYTVDADAEGGPQIVGTSVTGTPNSFLCTDRDYGDFVLTFEVKVDAGLNSGVQFRSECSDEPLSLELKNDKGETYTHNVPAGRVHGYQAEIDPTPRGFSGGVYDEARRGWLWKPEGDKYAAVRTAFNPDGWNSYRIVARGNHIATSINSVPVAHFHDNMTPTGFIALQVHGIGDDKQLEGAQVRWRNLRLVEQKP